MVDLVSFEYERNSHRPSDFRTRTIGTSDCVRYMPVYSIFSHRKYEFAQEKVVYEWCLPSIPGDTRLRRRRQYSQLIHTLIGGSTPLHYVYKLRGIEHAIQIHRGLIYEGDKVLMCLGIDSEYVFSNTLESLKSRDNSKKLTLFINNDFAEDPKYKNIYKKVFLMYIKELKDKGVDVVYTSRLNSWLFSNNFKIPKFKKVTEMLKHLKEEVPGILLTE